MGWTFRKSLRFGPFRLNLSKSGLGASTGVGGANISSGPKGTYASFSKFGFRFFKKLKAFGFAPNLNGKRSLGSNVPNSPQFPIVASSSVRSGTTHPQNSSVRIASHQVNQALQSFKAILIQHLTSKPPQPFDFLELVLNSGITQHDAQSVSVELFKSYVYGVFSDQEVTDIEKIKVKQLAEQLCIDELTVHSIIQNAIAGK